MAPGVKTAYDGTWVSPLLKAHADLLRKAHELLKANSKGVKGIGLSLSFALEMHLLQLGRGLQSLCETGYAEVAESTARAMLSAAVNLLAILKADSDRVALQYLVYSVQRRRKYLSGLVKNNLLTQEQAGAYDAAVGERDDAVLAQYKKQGIEPLELGGDRKDTWSSLTDRALFEYAGVLPWYEVHYVPLSDGAHASVSALAFELTAMSEGAIVTGPRWTDPILLVSTSVDVVGGTLTAFIPRLNADASNNAWKIQTEAVEAMRNALKAAAAQKSSEWPPI
jgi:uncharacterized protein DUF5677